jgi:hypothetical protein
MDRDGWEALAHICALAVLVLLIVWCFGRF